LPNHPIVVLLYIVSNGISLDNIKYGPETNSTMRLKNGTFLKVDDVDFVFVAFVPKRASGKRECGVPDILSARKSNLTVVVAGLSSRDSE
jgi:hypothetical protein